LHLGKRSAIDQALYRSVKNGQLVRLARGVFMKAKYQTEMPSKEAIVKYKVEAFHRRHLDVGSAVLQKNREVRQEVRTVATDGHKSSFGVLDGLQEPHTYSPYCMRAYCPRKLALGDTRTGLFIRSLWDKAKREGRKSLTDEVIADALKTLKRAEYDALPEACRIMPAWLASTLIWDRQRFSSVRMNTLR
jgi:hypothetical protein